MQQTYKINKKQKEPHVFLRSWGDHNMKEWHSVEHIPPPRPNSPLLYSLIDTSHLPMPDYPPRKKKKEKHPFNVKRWEEKKNLDLSLYLDAHQEFYSWPENHPPHKFHRNLLSSFCVILLTNQQTKKRTLVKIKPWQRYKPGNTGIPFIRRRRPRAYMMINRSSSVSELNMSANIS